MKKTIATCLLLILILSCVFSFVACTEPQEDEDCELEAGLYRSNARYYIRIKSDGTVYEYNLLNSEDTIDTVDEYKLPVENVKPLPNLFMSADPYLHIYEGKWQLDKETKTVTLSMTALLFLFYKSGELYHDNTFSPKTRKFYVTTQGLQYHPSDNFGWSLIEETDCPQIIESYEEWIKQQK